MTAYNFAQELQTLKGLIPYECLCKTWATALDTINRPLPTVGLNTQSQTLRNFGVGRRHQPECDLTIREPSKQVTVRSGRDFFS